MQRTLVYPESCRENIQKLVRGLHTDTETAYAMILLMAALMDLRPADGKVAEMILKDADICEEGGDLHVAAV